MVIYLSLCQIVTADLYTLSTQSGSIPARALPDPNNVDDGETVISDNNQWVAGRFVYRQASAPPNPPSGAIVLWVDISDATNPLLKVWNESTSTWDMADDIQDNSITNAHLGLSIVDPDNLNADTTQEKANFRTRIEAEVAGHNHGPGQTPIADDVITPSMAQADTPQQQAAWRTRLDAEEAGHHHGTGDTPIADDAITPSMAQADTNPQKEAWRLRLDTKADIADWAEEGNTSPMPRSKYGDSLIDADNFDTLNDALGTEAQEADCF